MTSVDPEVIIVHSHISIDFHYHFFQYVESSLTNKLFVFGKSSSKAISDIFKRIRDNPHVSQSSPLNGDPLSVAGLSLYTMH